MGEIGGAGPVGADAGTRRWRSTRAARLGVSALAVVALVATSVVVFSPSPASAGVGPSTAPKPAAAPTATAGPAAASGDCVTVAAKTTCTYTYANNASQWWPKPGGEVKSVEVVLNGAQGGNGEGSGLGGSPGSGGKGGTLQGWIDVSNLSGLTLDVGQQGKTGVTGGTGGTGGWPDGGDGGSANDQALAGCGGGGSSAVLVNGYDVFRAGGGGGCGGYFVGFNGANGGDGGKAPAAGSKGYSEATSCNSTGGRGLAGGGGGGAAAAAGGTAGGQGFFLDGVSCNPGNTHYATDGVENHGGTGSHSEPGTLGGTGGGGGGGGGGGSFGGGGGGGGQKFLAIGSGGGGAGGGGHNGTLSAPLYIGSLGTQTDGVHTGDGSISISYSALPTVTTVTAAGLSYVEAGQSVTFTATVVAPKTVGAPNGKVVFEDIVSGNALCEGTEIPATYVAGSSTEVSTSSASCTISDRNTVPPPAQCVEKPPSDPPPPPLPGACSFNSSRSRTLIVQASYKGGPATLPSVSDSIAFSLLPEATDTAMTQVPGSTDLAIEVTGLRSPFVPIEGKVTVLEGVDTPVAECTDLKVLWTTGNNKATATCPLVALPGQARQLTAKYLGAYDTMPSYSPTLDLTVERVPTRSSVAIAAGPRTYGHSIQATATVARDGAAPLDGTVTFTDTVGGVTSDVPGCLSLAISVSGQAVCAIARPVAGSHDIRAHYSGGSQTAKSDSVDDPATTDDDPVVIVPATPTVDLQANPAGGTSAGQQVALTARLEMADDLSANVPVVEGSITFTDNGADIAGCVDLAVNQPATTCAFVPALIADAPRHQLAARYVGAPNLTDVTFADVPYDVDRAGTTTTLELVPAATTVAPATPVTVRATVTSTVPAIVPAGHVELFDKDVAIAACAPHPTLDASGQATCTFIPAPGIEHRLTAKFVPDVGTSSAESTTAAPLVFDVGKFASTTTLEATPATAVFGEQVVLKATMTLAPGAPDPTGTVAFRDGGATLSGCGELALVPVVDTPQIVRTATCSIAAPGGDHTFTATYSGDQATAGSGATAPRYTVAAVATATVASAKAATASELALSATVSAVSGVTPVGSVSFEVDGAAACQDVPLTSGTASCWWPADPTTAHTIDAVYTPPSGSKDFTGSTAVTVDFQPGSTCSTGETALWTKLNGTPSAVAVSGGGSSFTAVLTGAPGACSSTPVQFVTHDIALFGGVVKGSGSGVFTGGGSATSVCLTRGDLELPDWLKVPTLSVSSSVCWSLDDAGDLAAAVSGQVTATSPAGTFPFVSLSDIPATAVSLRFSSVGGVNALGITLAAGPASTPLIELSVDVSSSGAYSGTLRTPGLVLFGQSLAGFEVAVSGGAGQTPTILGTLTLTAITVTDGFVIDSLAVTLSNTGFTIAAKASVGVGEQILHLAATGALASAGDWSLALAVATPAVWEPVPGLQLNPTIQGYVSRTAGVYAFDVTAGAAAPALPLVVWQPANGASVTVQRIQISSSGADCVAANGADHLALSFTGSLALSSVKVGIEACADLTTGAYHLKAETTAPIALTADLALANADLTADGGGGVPLALSGGGDIDIKGHIVRLRFNLAASGALVVGASVDLTDWGVPVQGYVAYASVGVAGFVTGDARVGTVDLEAGLTAVAVWTPTGAVASLLSSPAPDGVGLSGGGIRFVARISAAKLTFTAEINAPSTLPFLTLPGSTTIDEIALTFTHEATGNKLQLHLAATVDVKTKIVFDFAIAPTDGTFTAQVDVKALQLFGRDVDLTGKLTRKLIGTGPSFEVVSEVHGSVGSEADPIGEAPVQFTKVDLTLGTAGIRVKGGARIAGRSGLEVDGQVYTKPDAVAGYGEGGWSLAVKTTAITPWTPTDGVTFSADLSGRVTKKTSTTPVTFRLEAQGANGGNLFTLTPDGAPVSIAVKGAKVGNEFPAPNGCAAAAGNVWLSVTGSFSATIASSSGEATATGCYDLTSGQFALSADLSGLSVSIGTVKINGPRFTVARTPSPSTYRVTAEVTIELDLLGKTFTSPKPGSGPSRFTAQLTFTNGAFVVGVRANLGDYGLGGVGGDAYLYYASAVVEGFETGDPSLSKIDPATGVTSTGRVDLVQGINFAVRLTLPASVSDGLSKTGGDGGTKGVAAPTGAVTAIGQVDTAAKAFSFKIQFQSGVGGQEILKTKSGARLVLDSGYLKFTVKTTEVSFGLGLALTLHLPPVEDASKPMSKVKFTGELTISTTGILVSLQIGTCNSGQTGWPDAFGIPGLTVECAALQGGISYAGVPTVGFLGKVTALPQDLADAIGYVQGAPMQFAFNLDPFMLSVSIGVQDSKKVALRPLQAFGEPDLIQVRYASLYAAPVAVTVGQTTFPAGFGIGFQASIAGVDVNVLASVDPNKPSISMHASVTEIAVGALKIGPVVVDFLASPSDFHFMLDGKLRLGPGMADIGPALKIGGELNMSVHVSIAKTGIAAFFWGDAKVELHALIAQEVCYWRGQIPLPCNFQWESTDFSVTLGRTGFSVDGSGLTLAAGGYSITLPWTGAPSTASPDSPEAKEAQRKLEEELRKGTDKAALPSAEAGSATAIEASGHGTAVAGAVGSPAEPVAVAVAPLASTPEPAVVVKAAPAPPQPSAADGDELTVSAPTASDKPMAAAPLPAEVTVDPSNLIGTLSIIAPPSGENPAGERPAGETTTVVIDPAQLPGLAGGDALGEWASTGALREARTNAAIASLPDGRVLLTGGSGLNGPLASTEIFDPATGAWKPAASMATARSGAASAVLPDGRVLVAGGTNGTAQAAGDHAVAAVEIYDPTTGRWTQGAALGEARAYPTTTVLADGSVLVAGGLGASGPVDSTEMFDPTNGRWSVVGALSSARGHASASRLADGRVLVTGGEGADGLEASAEVFDPAVRTWQRVADMPAPSMMDTATTLADGRVLVAGSGTNGKLYDPASGTWSRTGAFGTVRAQATAVTLPSGDVMLIGGTAGGQVEGDAEIYDAETNTWQTTTDMPSPTASASAVVLPDGSVLAVGGADRSTPLAGAAIYNKGIVAVTVVPAAVPVAPVAVEPPLPVLGSEVGPPLLVAFGLLLGGTLLILAARRRRAEVR